MVQTRPAAVGTAPGCVRNPWLVLLVLCLGFLKILLDTTIVNIAIPSMIDALKASLLVYCCTLMINHLLSPIVRPR
jgi:hypothetical protein